MIGNNACGSRALAYGRTADNVLALDMVAGTGTRFTAAGRRRRRRPPRRGWPRRRPAGSRRPGPRPTSARSGPSWAGSAGRCPATRSSTCCPRTAPTSPRRWSAPRAPLALARRDRPAGRRAAAPPRSSCSATPTWPPPPRPCPRCWRTARSRSRAWTPGWSTSSGARRGPAAVPDLPRGGGWLMVEMGGATPAEAEAAAPAARARRRRRPPGQRRCSRRARGRALWRIREDGAGLGRSDARRASRRGRAWRTRRCRPSGSAPTCASSRR